MTPTQLKYSCTNEDIGCIINGLDVNANDDILAIGGSGDQAFAFLEYARRVIAVDNDQSQIDFIEHRARSLRDGYISSFLAEYEEGTDDFFSANSSRKKASINYFNQEDRLNNIINNLSNLEIKGPADIFQMAQNVSFNKVYLSNAASYGGGFNNKRFLQLVERLPEGGLIYVSDPESRLFIQSLLERTPSYG